MTSKIPKYYTNLFGFISILVWMKNLMVIMLSYFYKDKKDKSLKSIMMVVLVTLQT